MKELIVLGALMVAVAHAKLYCASDDDCTKAGVGELFCIKSFCGWGICSCPFGKAAKFLGSKDLYKCVDIKKIGQRCSNSGDDGVCGPEGSICSKDTDKCECQSGKVAVWGGEKCEDYKDKTFGETCGSVGSCGTCSSQSSSSFWYHIIKNDVPTCACGETTHLGLTNVYSTGLNFISKREPKCIDNMIGDFCLVDAQCNNINNAVCHNNKCACREANHVPSAMMDSCKKALPHGAKCFPAESPNVANGDSPSEYHCDGTKGLICGDKCAFMGTSQYVSNTTYNTCSCSPHHTTSGSTCSPIGDGGSCYGDYNCKGWKMDAICVDGKCQNGVASVAAGIVSLLVPIMTFILRL